MNNSNQEKKTKKPPPSFDGRGDFDISLGPMDEGDNTTRRACAGISFEPISPFAAGVPSFSPTRLYDPSMQKTEIAKQQAPVSVPAAPIVKPFIWKLDEVPTLPELHPLESTAVFVENSTPGAISGQISQVLRERSIEAEYENEKAKAKCISPEGVDFRIRMYRGRGKFSHGIIVEVQRRFGSSVNFHKHVTAILDAAQGFEPMPPPPALSGSADALPVVSDNEDDYVPKNGADSLKMVEKMFGHGGYDSMYLALQTLSSLTDSKKMGKTTARVVSTAFLSTSNTVGNKVFDILCENRKEEEGFQLRVTSLSILTNALEAVEGNVSQFIRELIRPVLLKELSKAESNPRSAQLAAHCFEFLYSGDHDQGEIMAALETARSVGAARHDGLYQQAQRCLDKML